MYCKVNQLYIYIYTLFFRLFSHIGHYRVLSRLSCAIQEVVTYYIYIVVSSIPGLGRSPGGGHGNPLQYSCLENPMDRGVWQATVHVVTKSWTWMTEWLRIAQHIMYTWVPISQFIPPLPPYHLVTISFVFQICNSFCFVNKFIYTLFFLHSTYKWYHVIFVFLCLTSFT